MGQVRPTPSMGPVYLPTFTITINYKSRYIYRIPYMDGMGGEVGEVGDIFKDYNGSSSFLFFGVKLG